jgi:regulatory protein
MRRHRPPSPPTAAKLDHAALAYLEHYASSAANLRRVLMRRVERAARAGIAAREDGAALVDALVARFRSAGLLDDKTYAEGRVQALHRSGRSRALIRRTLAAKGVADADIAAALRELDAASADPDLRAALAFARRRRLGPFRPAAERAGRRARDLAALGRAGFGYDIARRIVDAPSPQALAAEIAAGG